jgi:hypothetical protein
MNMKKYLIVFTLIVLTQSLCKAANIKPGNNKHCLLQNDSLANYTGKYKFSDREVYIHLDIVNGDLVGTQLWDGNKVQFKRLHDDDFIVIGYDWSVKFLRDKDKKVTGILVRGTDKLIKISQ